MVNMLQAGLLDKGRLPNDMQGVLLEEQAAGGATVCVSVRLRAYVCTCVHISKHGSVPISIHGCVSNSIESYGPI